MATQNQNSNAPENVNNPGNPFSKSDIFRIWDLHDEILKVKQGTKAVAEYFAELKSLWDELDSLQPMPKCQCQPACSCGVLNQIKNMQERDRVLRFLKGLNEQFSHVSSQVMMIDPLPSINNVFSLVTQQEMNEPQESDQRKGRNDSSGSGRAPSDSLAEARGSIYSLAKENHGSRFLQSMFDKGTPEDAQVIFSEIINHVVELMMNPFGNHLMRKLLDVCNEEQRMQIIRMVTEEPGQLVEISLNTRGSRVVQKLIGTLETRQQISLVVSALEPRFLDLIKDLNGNHVVQRCLYCLSNEDNKFIFVAAAKYCIDIATHQHGCYVLQRCIGLSSGEHGEKLVAEISANALQLAQDQFGNYIVQFILDLRIPSATATLSPQFEGNYVHLSMQKFSSHVVEKCLAVFNVENRSKVIRELLSAPRFEQLLQDPHANYVVQSALRLSEGRVHNLLVEAVESHKGISRNCPYSKSIFSQMLSKK